jgi:formate dehydrogenase iron-sulfur subunit
MTQLAPDDSRTLIDELLAEQRTLTAVDRFSRLHETNGVPAQEKFYRDLIPLNAPKPGEQFAFEVDLDKCSGCKGCVTACHSLNGLEETETWRSVGLLISKNDEAPNGQTNAPFDIRHSSFGFQQHVTTACHHCVDPACLNGCPVLAYDKDPITGIVRHLDDQCIGCQYCILKCPYDVPKYSAKRGIVRKCDMCSNRLAVGEAPACVQACPNEAIRITIVNRETIAKNFRAKNDERQMTNGDPNAPFDIRHPSFLPSAPEPSYTLPTTQFISKRGLPKNLVAANRNQLKPEHTHPPLVIMLVLTQLSVGAFCVDTLLRAVFPENLMMRLSPFHSLVAFGIGMLALAASTLHLGRPQFAWRAFVGLRNSWLSREIIVFGLFAGMAMVDAAIVWFAPLKNLNPIFAGALVSIAGLLGVFCSLMIYFDTRRAFWNAAQTTTKFFGTTALLGTATILFVTTLQALLKPDIASHGAYHQLTNWLTATLAAISSAKLIFEATTFRHLLTREMTPLKRAALLMRGELSEITTARFLMGAIGGVILPLVFLTQKPAPGFATLGFTLWILIFAALGEFLERRIFFAAAVAPRMPGGVES